MVEIVKIKFGQFMAVALSLACLILIYFVGALLWDEAETLTQEKISAETQAIKNSIQTQIDDLVYDAVTLTLKQKTNLLISSATKNKPALGFLQAQWKSMFEVYPSLQQIRFIDINGFEKLRVDNTQDGPEWVNVEQLQNKSDRYYFLDTLASNEDISLSKVDLNVENGVVEVPYRPTLRASSKYFHEGKLIGVVVLNFDLSDTFEFFRSQQSLLSHWIVNPAGYFLSAPDNSAWGWLLGRQDHHIKSRFPSLSAVIFNNDSPGSLPTSFTNNYSLDSLTISSSSNVSIDSADAQFWLITKKPQASIKQLARYQTLLIVAIVVLSLMMLGITISLLKLIRNLDSERQRAIFAEKAKTEFLAHISHEIRTPMNGIYGLLQITQGERDYKKINENIEQAITSFSLLSTIVNDVLDFSKIEARKLHFDEVPFRLDTVLKQTGQMMGRAAYGKNIDLWIDIDPACPKFVSGDPVRLSQIITNLVSNAIKFTSKGEIVFRIELIDKTANHVNIGFSLQDTGIGMTEEQVDCVFSPFTQASTATSTKFGGTGLGLSIAKQLVELMDGEISVASELGVGSTFQFHVKLNITNQQVDDDLNAIDFESYKAMILTKNVNASAVIRRQCAVLGWPTIVFDSPEKLSLYKVKTKLPLVLLIDEAVLKTISDQTLLHWQSANESVVNIVIVSHNKNDVDNNLLVLVDNVLIKPFTPSTLYDIVSNNDDKVDGLVNTSGAASNSSKELDGKLLLIVEDNAINRQIAATMLESAGAIIKFAENGQECLDLLSQNGVMPDLILMDMQMPIMNGIEASKKIRENSKWDNIPILAMTANALDSDKKECIDAGMQGHIAKPILKQTLIDAVIQKLN